MRVPVYEIRNRILQEEFDTATLLQAVSEYPNPRQKIHQLLRQGIIISVKRGVYVFSEALRRRPYSKEALAALIYGPSYISLESALQNYGFIPENVELMTSVTLGKSKLFRTPTGEFRYFQLAAKYYPHGIQLRETSPGVTCLHASAEKCLVDFVYFNEEMGDFKNAQEYFSYLVESYRWDLEMILKKVDVEALLALRDLYSLKRVRWATDMILERMPKGMPR